MLAEGRDPVALGQPVPDPMVPMAAFEGRALTLALEADRQLAGSMDLRVLSTSGARMFPQEDGTLHIGAEWKIQALFD